VSDAFAAALALPYAPWILAGSYLLGSIPFGYLLALLFAKEDVRTKGSGNIGATNVARVVGKRLGALTLVLDALKGAAPVLLLANLVAPSTPGGTLLQACAGLCAFLGHCFPVWLRFRGGKGVATGAGFLFAHLPFASLFGLVAFAFVYAIARVVSASSLAAAFAVLVAVLVMRPLDAALLPIGVMFLVLVLRHTSNIKRLLHKEELKV
jgi:acyl phosphate:glycerol-3-phosphate acyltransferase